MQQNPCMRNAIVMKLDRPTVLMADAANLSGRFKVWYSGNWAKRYPVSEWRNRGDSFTWTVESSFNGEANVTALIKGDNAKVQLSTCDPIAISTNWNRIDLGMLHLKAGINTVTLSSFRSGGEMELYSLELVKPDLKSSLKQQADEMRSDTSWMREAKYGLQFHWTSKSQPRDGKQKALLTQLRTSMSRHLPRW